MKIINGEKRGRPGRWMIDYYDQRGVRHNETFPTQKAAKAAMVDRLGQVKRGSYRAASEVPSVAALAEAWLANKANRRPATVAQWENHVHGPISPTTLGQMRADKVTTQDVEEWRDARKAAGLSPQTVNKILTTLTAIYKYANARDVTDRNPAIVAERLRLTSGELVASRAADESETDSLGYVPAPDEAWRLIEKAEPGLFQTYFLTAVLTGARQEELLALGWADVDFDGLTIKIRRAISWARTRSERGRVKGARFFEPKTKASKREIPIPRDLAASLKRWKLACPIGTLDLVFPMADGSPMHRKVLYDYGLLPALERAALPHFTIHALRHTFASTLAMQGKPVTEISALLGHSSPVVTLRVYSHWFKSVKTTSIEDVAAAVLGGRAIG